MTPEESKQLNGDIRTTFTEFEAGVRVYKWLEKLCFKYKVGMVIGQPDTSAYNEGHRDVIIEIDERIRRATEPPPLPLNTINTKG
jgi:hypothetical protein